MFGNRVFSKIAFVLTLSLVWFGISESAWAQFKLLSKIIANPTETDNPLIFDVNNVSDDNISPNIILSADGKRGFVAYTGVGEIVEFSLEKGEILKRIPTEGTPSAATRLPNDRIAFVSVFRNKAMGEHDNRIFVVDMNTSSLVTTYEFTNAAFGFGSIIELAPDGTTGFVSSTGTGEVIKFDVNDGHEIGRMRNMRHPAQITVTPDGATIIVIDVDQAPPQGTPEVVFADATTLSRKGTLKNPDATKYYVNFTIFNKAVLAPDGLTGIIASRGQNNILYGDVVFHFNASNGTILKIGNTGSGPGWTGITPDGKLWVILNMFSVTVIPTDNFDLATEFQGANGEPLGSANVVFSPDSRYAYYAASMNDLIFQMDLTDGAVVDQLKVGDAGDLLVDQPSSMAITADGKMFVALEFSANNIDLMIPVTMVAAAKYQSSLEMFTGLCLINLSPKVNVVTVYAMLDFGELSQETGVNNPVSYTLEPNQQISLTVAEIFNFDDSTAPEGGRTGWLAIYSDEPEITGYLSIGKKDMTSLNGLSLDPVRIYDWILPEINRIGDEQMSVSLLNATYYSVQYEVARVAKDGAVIDSLTTSSVPSNSRLSRELVDLFPRSDVEREAYLYMTSPEGLRPSELYNNATSVEIIKGIDREKFKGVTRLFAPQFANVPGFRTFLNVINANQDKAGADVTITLHAPDGSVLGQVQKHFALGEQLKDDIANIFADNPAVVNSTGWLEIESSLDYILGIITFKGEPNRFAASFEFSGAPLDRFTFPIVGGSRTFLNLINANQDAAGADVTITLRAANGSALGQVQKHFAVGEQLNDALANIFAENPGVVDSAGWLEIESSQNHILGTITFSGEADRFAAGFELSSAPLDRFMFPVVAGYRTFLDLNNTNEDAAGVDVTITLRAPDGSVLSQVQKHFAVSEQLNDDIANIFADNPGVVDSAGWLEIESSQNHIPGTITYKGEANRFATSFELSGTPLDRFLFPIVSQNEAYQTGVAMLNSNTEPAQVKLELWGPDALLHEHTTITLAPQTRTAVYLNDIFPNMESLFVGNLRIRSDKALYGFSLMHDSGFNFLMALSAVPLF